MHILTEFEQKTFVFTIRTILIFLMQFCSRVCLEVMGGQSFLCRLFLDFISHIPLG